MAAPRGMLRRDKTNPRTSGKSVGGRATPPALHPLTISRATMNSMAIRFLFIGIAVSATTLSGLRAAETATERHAMARTHLQRAAAELSEGCLSDVRSLGDW